MKTMNLSVFSALERYTKLTINERKRERDVTRRLQSVCIHMYVCWYSLNYEHENVCRCMQTNSGETKLSYTSTRNRG